MEHTHECGVFVFGKIEGYGCGFRWSHATREDWSPSDHYCPRCGRGPFTVRVAVRINIENLLRQVGLTVGDRYGYKYVLGELTNNLKELRDRSRAGDGQAALDEFLRLYVFSDDQGLTQQRSDQP